MDQGLATSTLRVQVAALSAFLYNRLSMDPLIKRLLLAKERMNLVKMNTFPLWDLTLVLEAPARAPFELLAQVPLNLSLKVAFLRRSVGPVNQ